MPSYLPHVLGLPFVLTAVVVIAATMLSIRHLRPAAGVAFVVALIYGWRAARAVAASESDAPEAVYSGLGVLPAAFSTLGVYLVAFVIAAGVVWAVQTVRNRRVKHTPTVRTLDDWTPTGQ